MKRLLILLFCLPLFSLAQNTPLIIEGISPDLYLTHTVKAKENYYSIGRMYNISPKLIAPFNNFQLEKGLSLNQIIKVPLDESNFLQVGNAAADEVLVPLYHTIKDKEGLYRITVNYNKLPLENLKKWNNIQGETAPNGTTLIVGYLKVKKELSSLAAIAKAKPFDNTKAAPIVKKDITVTSPVIKPTVVLKKSLPVPVKENEIVVEPVKKTAPVIVKEAEPQPTVRNVTLKNFNGGFFKTLYNKQLKNDVIAESGGAAVFKSNSGWQDGKYYCLHNTASPGTIIKLTSTATGKIIFAKVLDVIPDLKQNNGLIIRISNSAAQELGVGDERFECTLGYSKY